MTATERLRAMLDERGVEWWPSDERWNADVITHWYAGLLKWTAIEGEDGLWVNAGVAGHNSLTPEQAIAATLGDADEGTCRRLPADNYGVTCFVRSHGLEMEFGYWKCSKCGTNCFEGARYCMNCGAKVVDDG